MVRAKIFDTVAYQQIAELIGKARDLDEFYRLFVQFAQTENEKFSIEKFHRAVQKSHQFGEKLPLEAENLPEAYESDGQPDEVQEWRDFDEDS